MIKKSSFKIKLGLIVFSLLVLCSISMTFAQRPLRNLGVTATGIRGCDPIVGCWDPPMSWPLEAIHSAVVPTQDRVNSLAKVLMWDFGTYSAPTTTVSAKLWDPYCTAATPNDPSCFTSVTLLITIAGQSGVTTFCSGHNFLSDGKLLTIGGDHINAQPFGQAKGPVISYAFDPFADLTVPPSPWWERRAFLQTPVICAPVPPPTTTNPPNPPFDCSTLVGPGNPPAWDCSQACLAGGRFYPTGIAMDVQIGAQTFLGQVLAFSGLNINTTQGLNHTIERYDPNSGPLGTWTIRGIDGPPIKIDSNSDLYPRMHLFPSSLSGTGPTGSVFYVAYSELNSSLYNPANDTYTSKAAPSTYREEGTSVLLPLVLDSNGNISNEVRILIAGGCNGRSPNPCTSNTAVNLNTAEVYRTGTPGAPLDRWDAAGTMSEQRQHPNAVLMPDGNVFVVGGEKTSGCNPLAVGGPKVCPGDSLNQCVPSYTTDLFNPVTNTWLGAPSASRPRQYHSGAVLLEDGRVLVEGGDSDYACLCQGQTTCPTAQLYYPGYWWRGNGPVMDFFPPPNGQIMNYGQPFTIPMVTNGTLISKVVLIRPSAVTHSFNNEQRYLVHEIINSHRDL